MPTDSRARPRESRVIRTTPMDILETMNAIGEEYPTLSTMELLAVVAEARMQTALDHQILDYDLQDEDAIEEAENHLTLVR